MQISSLEFRGPRPFDKQWSRIGAIKPINVIVGKNNSGKSQLISIIKSLCEDCPYSDGVEYKCSGTLDAESLRAKFPQNSSMINLAGNGWNDHGNALVGEEIRWHVNTSKQVVDLDGLNIGSRFGERSTAERIRLLKQIAANASYSLTRKNFKMLLADRDIRPEKASPILNLSSDGTGATNIIRRYIVSSSPRLPRELVQTELLDALNQIFTSDGRFTEIQIKQHDDSRADGHDGLWEIYLGEHSKGLVPLSRSGSGLKTVILVLLSILVTPYAEDKPKSEYIFALEELENNLHPALLRRLFAYLQRYAVNERSSIFLTTHSSVALDFFGVSNHAQIIHVSHDGVTAYARHVSAHFDHLGVISELGVKPSDLLQANGILWVEGPSDCIYLNRWIDLFTNGELQEGRDYQCAYYAGSLLARTQFTSPEKAESELINLLRVNNNIVVVCDGDRKDNRARIKDRVRRINREVKKIEGSHIWVTQTREIENYLPGTVIASALGRNSNYQDPGQYQLFFPRRGAGLPGTSYVEKELSRAGLDKMELAIKSAPYMTRDLMKARFDLEQQINRIISSIQGWRA
jgi:putative ATP-dependent endonuclease of OLD family